MAHLLVVKKEKVVRKETYYLTSIPELMDRVREEIRLLFYSAHDMLNDFSVF